MRNNPLASDDLRWRPARAGSGSPNAVATAAALTAATSIVDIVTRPTTPLLAAAERAGCRHAGGAAMVAAQTAAILSFLGLEDGRP